jgi:hypothetical protein
MEIYRHVSIVTPASPSERYRWTDPPNIDSDRHLLLGRILTERERERERETRWRLI